ncbi:hypothetical protein K469DRAFT_73477 [Zopfia rhizophila CBS 207.26]|uniref:Uncharacterized protein n=1 Tax=Zopfia rhizophila CBS 207.26 TaxID=1314779 RepID=A0A6A6EDT1_9PEZI|nr:hypothetical protein K469DRAFT_73477 [Zopfia rhizophila CBS 207.26]
MFCYSIGTPSSQDFRCTNRSACLSRRISQCGKSGADTAYEPTNSRLTVAIGKSEVECNGGLESIRLRILAADHHGTPLGLHSPCHAFLGSKYAKRGFRVVHVAFLTIIHIIGQAAPRFRHSHTTKHHQQKTRTGFQCFPQACGPDGSHHASVDALQHKVPWHLSNFSRYPFSTKHSLLRPCISYLSSIGLSIYVDSFSLICFIHLLSVIYFIHLLSLIFIHFCTPPGFPLFQFIHLVFSC